MMTASHCVAFGVKAKVLHTHVFWTFDCHAEKLKGIKPLFADDHDDSAISP
jgi:hypothetical protein